MRVGIVALIQESNTFIAAATTLEHFRQDLLLQGEAVRTQLEAAHHEVGGFFSGLAEAGVEAVPIFAARAVPYGVIEAEAFDTLLNSLSEALQSAGRLDGVLAAAHGATVSAEFPDADGCWLTRLRAQVGPRTPIIATLDPHANLSEAMVAATDALIAYRTNPHLDQRQRGEEAARLIVRTLRGEVRPAQAAVTPPMAINIECQQTADPPCRGWYELAEQIARRPGILSVSPILGFPYADVAEMGSAAVVVADDDRELARQAAQELADDLWSRREEFRGRMVEVEEALARAAELPGPVLLLDMGDNVGAGSPADGTELARALESYPRGAAFVCLNDPETVALCAELPLGARTTLRIGGKTDGLHGAPLEVTATVLGHFDGKFREPQPRHGGFAEFDQGPTLLLRTDRGTTLMITSRRTPPWSLAQLRGFGLRPEDFQVIVAKGVVAPLAAYREVCTHFIRVNTPGATCADLHRLAYRHRRRPMFPFEEF